MDREYRIYYEVNYGGVTLTGISISERHCGDPYILVKETDGVMMLPEIIDGIHVKFITDYCFMGLCGKDDDYHDISVTELIIPASYRKLGQKNFSRWNSLRCVTLFCDAMALCRWNFAYCDALCEVRCLGNGMYDYCINLPESVSDYAYGCFDRCLQNIRFVQEFDNRKGIF